MAKLTGESVFQNSNGKDRLDLTRRILDLILYLNIPIVILLHLFASPYTKVEESFHIQAIHDILTYGVPSPLRLDSASISEQFRLNYDHFSFPGAVPRTFVGALSLAGASWPIIWFNEHVDRQLLGTQEYNEYLQLILMDVCKSSCHSRPFQCLVYQFIRTRNTEIFR